jgi:hypothetical protein
MMRGAVQPGGPTSAGKTPAGHWLAAAGLPPAGRLTRATRWLFRFIRPIIPPSPRWASSRVRY